jgi:hypothetical protein
MMKKIALTQNKFALVDDSDYGWLSQWKWQAVKNKHNYYAVRGTGSAQMRMHRLILGLKPNDGLQVDHINGNGLCNLRSNLRLCTNSQNQWNRKRACGTSQYKGVHWNARLRKWVVQIRKNTVGDYLGLYDNEMEAAKTYDKKAKELFGQFASLNFPTQERVKGEI